MNRTTGLGSGIVLLWFYGQIATWLGLEPMPPEVAAAIAGALMEILGRVKGPGAEAAATQSESSRPGPE